MFNDSYLHRWIPAVWFSIRENKDDLSGFLPDDDPFCSENNGVIDGCVFQGVHGRNAGLQSPEWFVERFEDGIDTGKETGVEFARVACKSIPVSHVNRAKARLDGSVVKPITSEGIRS